MKKKTKSDTNSPAFEARVGAIRVSVWRNESESGSVFFNTTLERRYREGTEWKSTPSYTGFGDCVQAAAALDLAMEYLKRQELEPSAQ